MTAGRIDEVAQEEGRHGEIMLSMTIEDGEGSIHLRVRSHAIPKEEGLCVPGRCIPRSWVCLREGRPEAQLQVDAVESLDEVRLRASKTLLLHIEPTDRPSFLACRKRSEVEIRRGSNPRGLPPESAVTIGWIERSCRMHRFTIWNASSEDPLSSP